MIIEGKVCGRNALIDDCSMCYSIMPDEYQIRENMIGICGYVDLSSGEGKTADQMHWAPLRIGPGGHDIEIFQRQRPISQRGWFGYDSAPPR